VTYWNVFPEHVRWGWNNIQLFQGMLAWGGAMAGIIFWDMFVSLEHDDAHNFLCGRTPDGLSLMMNSPKTSKDGISRTKELVDPPFGCDVHTMDGHAILHQLVTIGNIWEL
jgi:hypothetical protein